MEHSIVFSETGTFAAWPANNGIWRFANGELLVGLSTGRYEEKKGHNGTEPYSHPLARSKNGGRSWAIERPHPFVDDEAVDTSGMPVDFAHPDLAIRMIGNGYPSNSDTEYPRGGYYVSYDAGRTWSGLRSLGALPDHPEFAGRNFSARTNYLVDADGCLMFASTRIQSDDKAVLWGTEKVAAVRTRDGLNFEFLGWIVPPSDPFRATMPSGVRMPDGTLYVAARRRDLPVDASTGANSDQCWLDGYQSNDNGLSWSEVGRIANTGKWNGNPPALTLTADGRICCVYGNRDRSTIEAVFSSDTGRTWSDPTVLRSDYQKDSFGDPDLGYCRVIAGADGELVATYYWATAARPHHHIAATRWRP